MRPQLNLRAQHCEPCNLESRFEISADEPGEINAIRPSVSESQSVISAGFLLKKTPNFANKTAHFGELKSFSNVR